MTKLFAVVQARRWARGALVGGGVALTGLSWPAVARVVQAAPAASDEAPLVEAVEIKQNRFIPTDTLLYYISTRPGERYDDRRVRTDFRRLWDTGFLDDLLLDVQDGRKGVIVTFVVKERRRITLVDYRGSKALTRTSIEDKLKEKDAALKIDTFYDVSKIQRVEAIIRDMLQEAGRPFGKVRHEAKPIGGAGYQISFIVEDGPKTRVREIAFLGNRLFSDGALRHSMKKIHQQGFWNFSWLLGNTTYTDEKWREDQGKIEDFYRNHGYVTADVGEAQVFYEDCEGATEKKPCKYVRLEIPVQEGEQYRVGEIKVEGSTIFKPEAIRSLVKLKTGDVYRWSRLKKAYDKMREWYGSLGYFNWTPQTKTNPDPEKRVVDVTVGMQEDKRYYVGKIRFTGNETTRDKVVRREIFIDEGGVFNTEALKLSIKRINQLGYFKQIEDFPELEASALGDDKVDVTFKVKEENRNQFTVGGGVSGYEGTFVNSSFSTSNFLGAGETLQVSVQSGKRVRNYQFSASEPYFLDRPMTAGFDLYHRRTTYALTLTDGYIDQRTGGTLTSGFPISRFTRIFGSYTYEIVNVQKAKIEDLTTDLLYGSTGNVLSAAYLMDDVGRRRESRVAPMIVRNTVDNPYQPRSGMKLSATGMVAGGPLGGTLSYVSPDLEAIVYIPHTKKTALGLRAEGGWVKPFGDTARLLPVDKDHNYARDGLPFYHRFAVGGENQVRGYPFYSIYPATSATQPIPRGDKYLVFNAEYYLDVYGPLRLLAFFDAGAAFRNGESIEPKKFRMSTGLEARFTIPVMNVPFRLIYAINPNRGAVHMQSGVQVTPGTPPWLQGPDAGQPWVKRQEIKISVGTTF